MNKFFIYLLFLSGLFKYSNSVYPNILENSNIIASQYVNTSVFNLGNLVNGEEYKYSTGPIYKLPIYLYFSLEDNHFTSVYRIYWGSKPKTYSFFISDNCNYNFNYSYKDTINENQKNISFNDGNYFPPGNCLSWNKLPYYYFNELEHLSEAWVCGSIMCNNLDDYVSSSFLLKIEQLDNNQDIIEINQIEIEGLNTKEMVQLISPQEISFNITTDVIITDYTGFSLEETVALGNSDCSIIYNNLSRYDDNYTGNLVLGIGDDDSFIYNTNGKIENHGDHYICYLHNSPLGKKYYPQEQPLKVYSLYSINPNIIQRSSSYTINISSNYNSNQFLALAKDGQCENNMFSETEFVNKIGRLYENSDEIGTYFVCYSINNEDWSQQDLTVKVVSGEIDSVSGCDDDLNRTINCPTEGGNTIYIYGSDFDALHQNTKIYIGEYEATVVQIINTTLITCILPVGMGIDLSIDIEFNDNVYKQGVISYKKPEILQLNGCERDPGYTNKIINCPNSGSFEINLIGTNFGFDYSKILVGSQFCLNIVHHSHRNISCSLEGDRGTKKSLFLIQYQGEISEGVDYLSFKECDSGYEYYNGNCHLCLPGMYKNIVGDSYCTGCSDNTFTDEYGKSECNYCEKGKQVSDGSTKCEDCGERFFKNDITSISCSECMINQITYNTTESQCYYCSSGYEVINNECIACTTGYFKSLPQDIGCLFCEDGKYSDIEASTICKSCPDNSVSNSERNRCKCNTGYYDDNNNNCLQCDNTDFDGNILFLCNKEDLNLYDIHNSLGYWRSNKHSTTFYECKIEEHCPSNKIVNDSVICLDNHEGILCNLCIDDYAKDSDGYCYECSNDSNDDTRIKSLLITYFIIGVICFIFFISLVLLSGRGWLKKIVSFMKDKGFVEVKEDKSDMSSFTTSRKSSLSTISENSSVTSESLNYSVSSIDYSSSESNESITKKLRNKNLRKRKTERVFNEDSVESNTTNSEKMFSFAENIQQKFKILISYLQVISLLSSNLNIKWPDFIKNVVNGFNFVNLDILSVSQHDLSCSFDNNFYNNLILYILTIPLLLFFITISYFISLSLSAKYETKKIIITDRYIYCLIFFIFLIYPSVGSSILKTYKCELIEDEWYLTEDLSLKCFDEEWNKYAILSGVFIIVYIIGIPLFFYFLMKKNLEILKQSNDDNMEQTKESKRFSYRYGFMYMGYENKYWWFELIEMMKKIILLATVIYLEESTTRILIAMLMCFGYLSYVSYNKPLKYDEDDYLNVLSAIEIFLMLLCGLVLDVKLDVKDAYNQYAFQGFMFILLVGIVIIGNYEILKALFGGSIKPFTILKVIANSLSEKFEKIYSVCCKTKNYITDRKNSNSSEEEDSEKEDSEKEEIELTDQQSKFVKTQTLNMKKFMESIV